MTVFKIKFHKVVRTHFNPEFEDIFQGVCEKLPEVGERFSFWKSEDHHRLFFPPDISTNNVQNIVSDGAKITFITKSDSVYEIEILD